MKIETHIVNAFIDADAAKLGGNPAGVVLQADNLNAAQKQDIAAEIGLSETVFVSKSTRAPFGLEFFTPTRQIAQCGHATIAAFSLLKEFGMVSVGSLQMDTIDGLRSVVVGKRKIFLEQSRPEFVKIDEHRALYKNILKSLNISDDQLDKRAPPAIIDTGNKFLIIPMTTADAIKSLQPDMDAIAKISKTFGLVGYYIFSEETVHADRDAGTRMFAPAYGIDEESATGMAAGCLAAYLHRVRGLNQSRYLIEQGHLMDNPSPSIIDARVINRENNPLRIIVGGQAKTSHVMGLDI